MLWTTLEEMGHPQPPTSLQTENTTATSTGYSNYKIKQIHAHAMDMHFYWVKDRVKQGQFHVYWGPGYQKLADFFKKHPSPAHHKRMRPMNWAGIRDSALRGCINT
jgi:hypothetical protein